MKTKLLKKIRKEYTILRIDQIGIDFEDLQIEHRDFVVGNYIIIRSIYICYLLYSKTIVGATNKIDEAKKLLIKDINSRYNDTLNKTIKSSFTKVWP